MAFSISLLLILVLSTTVSGLSAMASTTHHDFKETQLSLYMHDFTAGPNLTDIPVAGIAGKLWVFNQFGTLYVNDESLTEGPSRDSAVVGRAQGFAVTASLDGRNALTLMSIVFTNKKYNGSTIEVQGSYKQYEASTEVPVVSGTGKFRFARGYVIFETYFFDIPSGYSIIRCNITVHHY